MMHGMTWFTFQDQYDVKVMLHKFLYILVNSGSQIIWHHKRTGFNCLLVIEWKYSMSTTSMAFQFNQLVHVFTLITRPCFKCPNDTDCNKIENSYFQLSLWQQSKLLFYYKIYIPYPLRLSTDDHCTNHAFVVCSARA